ncbi:MAG: 30S ribosomal protein S20 [Desulfitobacteriaceae bacterium]|nr:30S ribosomal protein S20 [Desulfitobacteriaceae bacterium]MDD4345991.1 30S ribosomal protein S20 [Desulfitobacteriaceae bacterium]MDD4400380.1 30S ribosomal protein S20 [Desulfitobacteriaceae bacterium]
MPNIKSALKRVEKTRLRTIKNAAAKSSLRTTIRRFEESLSIDKETANTNLKKVTRALDKACSKGLIHKNMAARKKSRLTRKLAKKFDQAG